MHCVCVPLSNQLQKPSPVVCINGMVGACERTDEQCARCVLQSVASCGGHTVQASKPGRCDGAPWTDRGLIPVPLDF